MPNAQHFFEADFLLAFIKVLEPHPSPSLHLPRSCAFCRHVLPITLRLQNPVSSLSDRIYSLEWWCSGFNWCCKKCSYPGYVVLLQAWIEKLTPYLILNKIDRLIFELKLTLMEVFISWFYSCFRLILWLLLWYYY